MKFGFAEMAQMMESAKALITVAIVSTVGVGTVLGAHRCTLSHLFPAPRGRSFPIRPGSAIVATWSADRSCSANRSYPADRSCSANRTYPADRSYPGN